MLGWTLVSGRQSLDVVRCSLYILIKIESEFGLEALPMERGKVKPVDCLKKQWQEEAGKEKRY